MRVDTTGMMNYLSFRVGRCSLEASNFPVTIENGTTQYKSIMVASGADYSTV
jgi:hypothetical protein